jgi:hypothetical protein
MAQLQLQLMLLYDLTDSAAAYFEVFKRRGLLLEEQIAGIEKMISSWPGAVEYFYQPLESPRRTVKDRLMDLSLRSALRKVHRAWR